MDFDLKFNGIIKAPYKALKILLRAVGGGVQELRPQPSAAVKTQFFRQSVVIPFISLFKVYAFS